MHGWYPILRWVHDNIASILMGSLVAMVIVGWLVIEAFRSHGNRDEILRLRRRLYELEREKVFGDRSELGPPVLTSRWVPVGSAATTSDGGCLLMVEAASNSYRRIKMTVRVDGGLVAQSETMAVGQRIEVGGKSGIYSIELHGAEANQARIAVWLRSRHFSPAV